MAEVHVFWCTGCKKTGVRAFKNLLPKDLGLDNTIPGAL